MPYVAPAGYLAPSLIVAAGLQLAAFSGQPFGYKVHPYLLLSGLVTFLCANTAMTLRLGPSIPGTHPPPP